MVIPDTNVWSELTKRQGQPQVLAWLESNSADAWLSVVVIAEIRAGAASPKAGEKRLALEGWLVALEEEFRDRTLSFDPDAAHALGTLLVAKPQDAKMLDVLLAAQALSRNFPVATRNVRDFEWTGAKLIDPWTA